MTFLRVGGQNALSNKIYQEGRDKQLMMLMDPLTQRRHLSQVGIVCADFGILNRLPTLQIQHLFEEYRQEEAN